MKTLITILALSSLAFGQMAYSPGKLSTPVASPVAGSYGSTQSVTYTLDAAGTKSCYTTDGSAPTINTSTGNCSNGTAYTTAISVASTETLKACTFAPYWQTSSCSSDTYTISSSTPALVQAKAKQCNSASSCVMGSGDGLATTGAGHLIVVAFIAASVGGTPVADSGVSTYAKCSNAADTPIWYYCTKNSVASTTVTATAGGTDNITMIVAEFSNIDTTVTLPLSNSSTQYSQGVATTTSYSSAQGSGNTITPAGNGYLLVGIVESNNSTNTFTATGSWTMAVQSNNTTDSRALGLAYQVQGTAAAVANTGTCSSAQIIATIYAFNHS